MIRNGTLSNKRTLRQLEADFIAHATGTAVTIWSPNRNTKEMFANTVTAEWAPKHAQIMKNPAAIAVMFTGITHHDVVAREWFIAKAVAKPPADAASKPPVPDNLPIFPADSVPKGGDHCGVCGCSSHWTFVQAAAKTTTARDWDLRDVDCLPKEDPKPPKACDEPLRYICVRAMQQPGCLEGFSAKW